MPSTLQLLWWVLEMKVQGLGVLAMMVTRDHPNRHPARVFVNYDYVSSALEGGGV